MGKRLSQLNQVEQVNREDYLLVDGEEQRYRESKKVKLKDIRLEQFNTESFYNKEQIDNMISETDQVFSPESENAQSGKAIAEELENYYTAEAIDDKLDSISKGEFEGGVGQSTEEDGEIFNDYETNKALGEFSHTSGSNNIAGCMGFKILKLEYRNTSVGNEIGKRLYFEIEGDATALLEPVVIHYRNQYGLDNSISFQWGNNYDLCCNILQIYAYAEEENITYGVLTELPFEVNLSLATEGYLWVPVYPEIGNISLGTAAHAEGYGNYAVQTDSHSEGYNAIAAGKHSHTEGRDTVAVYTAHAEGNGSKALGQGSHAEGYGTNALGQGSHTEGGSTIAEGKYSHAEGEGSNANGYRSHAEGGNTKASGKSSHAEGSNSESQGENSHAEGENTKAIGMNSHSEGKGTKAEGIQSHAEGSGTKATKNQTHAEGNCTEATGTSSHAEGNYAKASGKSAHAENNYTSASGEGSHAEGNYTNAKGQWSHAEGDKTHANGIGSHSGGGNTQANGDYSQAMGEGVRAQERGQFACGTWNDFNDVADAVFVVGNGTSSSARSNALKVFKDGHAEVQKMGNANKSVATKEYVDNEIATFDFIKVVNVLPETGLPNKIYLVPKADAEVQDLFDEYIWANGKWEWITTKQIEVDLTDYVKNTEYPTSIKGGVVKIVSSAYGIGHNDAAGLYTIQASKNEIDAKISQHLPITPMHLDYAVKAGVTTNTETLTEEEKANACEWLGVNALAIQNTVSGGEKSLTVNDVSPLAHKCSLKLVSDTYEEFVHVSKNIYKFDSDSIFFTGDGYPITHIINENGTITFNGYTTDYYAELSIKLRGLVLGNTYTLSFRSPDGEIQQPQVVFFRSASGEELDNTQSFSGGCYTFTHTDENIDCYDCRFAIYTSPEDPFVNATFYPQLELGATATEWAEYGGVITEKKPYIENFSEVTVKVKGKYYTPNADGTVTDIESISPTMEITTDNEHVNICDFTYCVDTKKYIDNGRPYELIDTITTTEDVNEISFSIEPNGTPYNFEKVLIAMVTKQTAKTGTYNVYFNGEYAACFQNALSSSWNAHSVVELWVDKQLDKVRGRYSNHTNDWRNPNYSNVNMLFMLPKVVTSIKSIKLNCGDTVTPTGSTFEIWGVRA